MLKGDVWFEEMLHIRKHFSSMVMIGEVQWLEHLRDYENMFETGVVRANDY